MSFTNGGICIVTSMPDEIDTLFEHMLRNSNGYDIEQKTFSKSSLRNIFYGNQRSLDT